MILDILENAHRYLPLNKGFAKAFEFLLRPDLKELPAILKGWIDRVIRPGVAYEFLEGDNGEGIPNGLLKAKSALIFNTSNTETQRELKVFEDPLETLWKNCIFNLCGVSDFYRRMFNIIVTSSEEQRKEWLYEVKKTVEKYFPEKS